MTGFSYIKDAPDVTDLNPLANYVHENKVYFHGDGDGSNTGVQVINIKTKSNKPLDVIFVINNGQTLRAAFSYSLVDIKNWIYSNGTNLSGIVQHVISSNQTIQLSAQQTDKYLWIAVGRDGSIGSPTPSPTDSYAIQISGSYESPESLLLFSSQTAQVPTGTFENPSILNPNISGAYDSRYGSCVDGGYYFLFNASANIARNLTIIPENNQNFGIIISSVKQELKDWLDAGGAGPLTDGGSYENTGGNDIQIEFEIYETKTMYAAYYDSDNIGFDSCGNGNPFKVVSQQQINSETGGTFISPYYISNNDISPAHTLSQGECAKGGVYYFINTCTNADGELNIQLTSYSASYQVGMAYSNADKNVLADFLRTGNHNLIPNGWYVEGDSGSNLSLIVQTSSSNGYLIVYNPLDIGGNMCSNDNTHIITTKQRYCNTGGSGEGGRYATPYSSNSITAYHADGDGDVNGRFWMFGWGCGGFWNLSLNSLQGQNVGLAWSTSQCSLKSWLDSGRMGTISDSGGQGGLFGVCGYFHDTYNPQSSFYYDSYNNEYYYDDISGVWVRQVDDATFATENDLPGYSGWACGHFECQGSGGNCDYDLNYENFISADGDTFYANGNGTWVNPFDYNNYPIDQIISYCNGCNPSPSNNGGNCEYDDGNGGFVETNSSTSFTGPSSNNPFYFVIYLPDSDPSPQPNNFSEFDVHFSSEGCDIGYTGPNGGFYGSLSDPLPIGNNEYKELYYRGGDCNYSTYYLKVNVCAGQEITFDLNNYGGHSPRMSWSNDLPALNYSFTDGDYSPIDAGATEGAFVSGHIMTFIPSQTGLYYIAVGFYDLYDSCNEANYDTFSIATTQSCPNNSIGTSSSPIGISNNDSVVIDANVGDCFNGITYYSVNLCPDKSAVFTVTPSNDNYPQFVLMSTSLQNTKSAAEQYVKYGYYYSYNHITNITNNLNSSISSPLITNIQSSPLQRTYYIAVMDNRGYSTPPINYMEYSSPRCDRGGQVTIQMEQDCPIVNVGGSQDITGASRYDFDPYDNLSTKKRGISIVTGDPVVGAIKNFIYVPTLQIDDASSYDNISGTSINVKFYINNNSGVTTLFDTETTTKVETIIKNNKAYIKPLAAHEFIFNSVNIYTGLFVTTFTTSVGVFVRNQVVNLGDSFIGGREQYAYVTGINDQSVNLVIPVTQDELHNITQQSPVESINIQNGNHAEVHTNITVNSGQSITMSTTFTHIKNLVDIKFRII